jgi:hypothetical protein
MSKRIAPATSGSVSAGDEDWEGGGGGGGASAYDLTGLPGADLLEPEEPTGPVLVDGLPVGSLGTNRSYMAIAEDILDLRAGVTGGG